MFCLVVSGALKVGLDFVFVLALDMEVLGMALATVLANVFSAVLLLFFLTQRNDFGPKFGDKEIDSITIIDLQTFLSDLYKEYSYKYTEGFLKFFYLLFGHADRMEVIDPDRYLRMFVTRGKRLTMPKMTQADFEESEDGAEVYDDEPLLAMEKIFKSEDGNLLTAFYLGLYCGLRISECFALRWENINWEAGTITVNRQLHYEDGIWKLCAVKTLTSVREVIMPAFLQDYLDGYFEQQRKEQTKLGQGYRNTERVYDDVRGEWIVGGDFINRKSNGELLTNNSTKYWSKKIKAELGNEFKYHNLRHPYVKHTTKNISLQKQKSQTTNRFDSLGFLFSLLALCEILIMKMPDTDWHFHYGFSRLLSSQFNGLVY